jgi:lactoylglutathione lyase
LIKRISTAAIVVRDEKKAKEWYRDKLGFEVKSDEDHWVTVAPRGARGGPQLHLCKTKPLEPGNTGIAFYVDDLDKTYAELTKKGVKFAKKPVDEGWGRYAMLKDPDGNEFWLFKG